MAANPAASAACRVFPSVKSSLIRTTGLNTAVVIFTMVSSELIHIADTALTTLTIIALQFLGEFGTCGPSLKLSTWY